MKDQRKEYQVMVKFVSRDKILSFLLNALEVVFVNNETVLLAMADINVHDQ